MPIRIPESTKRLAFEMRKDNKTYAEISETTGISLRWCKQHLKDVVSDYEQKIEILSDYYCFLKSRGLINQAVRVIFNFTGTKSQVTEQVKYTIKKLKAKSQRKMND